MRTEIAHSPSRPQKCTYVYRYALVTLSCLGVGRAAAPPRQNANTAQTTNKHTKQHETHTRIHKLAYEKKSKTSAQHFTALAHLALRSPRTHAHHRTRQFDAYDCYSCVFFLRPYVKLAITQTRASRRTMQQLLKLPDCVCVLAGITYSSLGCASDSTCCWLVVVLGASQTKSQSRNATKTRAAQTFTHSDGSGARSATSRTSDGLATRFWPDLAHALAGRVGRMWSTHARSLAQTAARTMETGRRHSRARRRRTHTHTRSYCVHTPTHEHTRRCLTTSPFFPGVSECVFIWEACVDVCEYMCLCLYVCVR